MLIQRIGGKTVRVTSGWVEDLTISPMIKMFSPRISCRPIGSSPKRLRVVLKWRRTVFCSTRLPVVLELFLSAFPFPFPYARRR